MLQEHHYLYKIETRSIREKLNQLGYKEIAAKIKDRSGYIVTLMSDETLKILNKLAQQEKGIIPERLN